MHRAFWWLYLVSGTLLIGVTLPLLLELLILTIASLFPRKGIAADGKSPKRRLAVVIPAHNEETLIERCVKSLKASLPVDVFLLVVAHNCSDQTASRAQQHGASVLVVDDPAQKGKAAALRSGFAHAIRSGAEACVVVDADSVVSTHFLSEVQKALSEYAGAVQAMYKVLPEQSEKATLTSIAFQGFNVVRPRGRQRLGLSSGIFGNGFGLRREVLENVPYHADSVVEDLEYHIGLVTARQRVHLLEDVTVFGEMPQGSSGSATQRARWEGGRLLMMRRLPSKLLRGIARGECGLIEPLMDVLSMPVAMAAICLLVLLPSPLKWMQIYSVFALIILSFHFVIAVKAGPDFWQGMRVLMRVPRYIFWKLVLTPQIVLASRRDAAWVRTSRNESDFPSPSSADALE